MSKIKKWFFWVLNYLNLKVFIKLSNEVSICILGKGNILLLGVIGLVKNKRFILSSKIKGGFYFKIIISIKIYGLL